MSDPTTAVETASSGAAVEQPKENLDPRTNFQDQRQLSSTRFTVPADLKSQICSQIADSSESLPLWNGGSRASVDSTASQDARKVPDESDVATPLAEKGNPLDKTRTGDLSKTATATSESGSTSGKERPGGLRRLTTRIKRTISSNPSPSK